MHRMLVVGFTSALVLGAQQAFAQRPYDGIQAGLDAYRLAEEQRRANVAGQLRLSDELKFWSGLPTSRGETIYYYDPYYYGGYGGPGYVYGYAPPLVRQPIGRTEVQTGPNRWESHPVYDPPLTPYRASPPVNSPWLYGTPHEPPTYEAPREIVEQIPSETVVPAPPLPGDDVAVPPPPPPRLERTRREY
jgi:hypothetical protein